MRRKTSVLLIFVLVLNIVAVFATMLPVATVSAGDVVLYQEDFEDASIVTDGTNAPVFTNISGATVGNMANWGIFSDPTTGSKYLKYGKGDAPYHNGGGAVVDLAFDNPVKISSGTAPAVAGTLITPGACTDVYVEYDVKANMDSATKVGYINVGGQDAAGAKVDLAANYFFGFNTSGAFSYGKPVPILSVPSKFLISPAPATLSSTDPTINVRDFIIPQNSYKANTWRHIRYIIPITDGTGAYVAGNNNVDVYVDGYPSAISYAPFIKTSGTVMDRLRLGSTIFSHSLTSFNDTAKGFSIDNLKVILSVYGPPPSAPPTPTPTPTPTAPPIPTPTAPPIITKWVIYSEDFEEYVPDPDGWNQFVLGTDHTKYLIASPNQTPVIITFPPAPLNSNGGQSYGRNAKVTAQYRIARTAASDTSWNYVAFTDSARLGSGSSQSGAAVAAGARPVAVTDEGQWLYRSSFTSSVAGTSSNIIVPGIYSASSGFWHTIKYVTTVSDANGAYITPKVDIYVDNATAPVLTGLSLLNAVDKIDSIAINNVSSSSKSFCIDNILVEINVDAPATPTPTPIVIPAAAITIAATSYANASIVRVNVTGIINPAVDNKVVMIKGIAARYTYYNGQYKFVAIVDGIVTTNDIVVADGTPMNLIYGDINLNNVTDATDINLLKGAVTGNRLAANYFELLASDVNGDGIVNASDYNTLKGFISGNILVLPVCNK